jgi:hypothetical protein
VILAKVIFKQLSSTLKQQETCKAALISMDFDYFPLRGFSHKRVTVALREVTFLLLTAFAEDPSTLIYFLLRFCLFWIVSALFLMNLPNSSSYCLVHSFTGQRQHQLVFNLLCLLKFLILCQVSPHICTNRQLNQHEERAQSYLIQ